MDTSEIDLMCPDPDLTVSDLPGPVQHPIFDAAYSYPPQGWVNSAHNTQAPNANSNQIWSLGTLKPSLMLPLVCGSLQNTDSRYYGHGLGSLPFQQSIESNPQASLDMNRNGKRPLPNQGSPFFATKRARARKSSTMSSEKWAPCEPRIKQLYVEDGIKIEELVEIVNREFHINATRRQFLSQLERMGIMKNMKKEIKSSTLKHIQYRDQDGKATKVIRFNGHKKPVKSLLRHKKNEAENYFAFPITPPSPLPDNVSIISHSTSLSQKGTSTTLTSDLQSRRPLSETSPLGSLLKYEKHLKSVFSTDDSRYLLNDLQTLLMPENHVCPRCFAPLMRPHHEEDIFKLRNFMNLTKHIESSPNGREQNKSLPTLYKSSSLLFFRNSQRCTTIQTRYARLDISFWDVSSKLYWGIDNQYNDTPNNSEIAARLSITPNQPVESPVRIVLDFLPLHHPLARITYQATRPNDSEVFKMVKSGCISWLIEAIQQGTASLADRDEEGRSLFNYAIEGLRPDMCKFLIQNDADVNAPEPNENGFISPVFCILVHNGGDTNSNDVALRSECYRLALEADADPTLPACLNSGNTWNELPVWLECLYCYSLETCKQMLDLGKDYIPAMGECTQIGKRQVIPLMSLASDCGYTLGTAVHVVDKAILLLNNSADIACVDDSGDTILHVVLRCERFYEEISLSRLKRSISVCSWFISTKAPKDLLLVFITAGADVYARNHKGETPSMVARSEGREDEWVDALQHCGFDPREVLTYLYSNSENRVKQTSQLSLQEYCRTRKYDWRYEDRIVDEWLESRDMEAWLELLSDDERAEMEGVLEEEALEEEDAEEEGTEEEDTEEEGTEEEGSEYSNHDYDGDLDESASHRDLEDGAGEADFRKICTGVRFRGGNQPQPQSPR